MKCPKCAASDCIEIEINLKQENTVRFMSCRSCETKWWQREGTTIALDEVLNLAARDKK